MDWLVGIALILALYVAFRLIRRKSVDSPGHAYDRSELNSADALGRFDARECIYTDGVVIIKARVVEVAVEGSQVRFSLQPLHTEGLSVPQEHTLIPTAVRSTLHVHDDFVHAPYANWRLYFDRDLVHHISVIARKGADLKIMHRTILDYRREPDAVD